jgi:hypothetical protein
VTEKPKVACCPECGDPIKRGFVNAPSFGLIWRAEDQGDRKWWSIFGSAKRLQRDWFGFPKLSKEPLPACLCPSCKLVIVRYTAEG